jgi:hypothetical protein
MLKTHRETWRRHSESIDGSVTSRSVTLLLLADYTVLFEAQVVHRLINYFLYLLPVRTTLYKFVYVLFIIGFAVYGQANSHLPLAYKHLRSAEHLLLFAQDPLHLPLHIHALTFSDARSRP